MDADAPPPDRRDSADLAIRLMILGEDIPAADGHVSDEAVAALAARRATRSERGAVLNHIAICPPCRRRLSAAIRDARAIQTRRRVPAVVALHPYLSAAAAVLMVAMAAGLYYALKRPVPVVAFGRLSVDEARIRPAQPTDRVIIEVGPGRYRMPPDRAFRLRATPLRDGFGALLRQTPRGWSMIESAAALRAGSPSGPENSFEPFVFDGSRQTFLMVATGSPAGDEIRAVANAHPFAEVGELETRIKSRLSRVRHRWVASKSVTIDSTSEDKTPAPSRPQARAFGNATRVANVASRPPGRTLVDLERVRLFGSLGLAITFGLRLSDRTALPEDNPSRSTPQNPGRRAMQLVVDQLHRQGQAEYDAGRHQAAERRFEEALEILKKLYPPANFPEGSLELAKGLHYKTALLRSRGDLDEALELLKQALAMRGNFLRERTGPHDYANNLAALAVLHSERGEYDEALDRATEALSMRERVYKDRFPFGFESLASSVEALGILSTMRGDAEKGELLCRRALSMYEQITPRDPDKPDRVDLIRCQGHLVRCYGNLGEIRRLRGDLPGALVSKTKALEISQRLVDEFDAGRHDLAKCLQDLGALHLHRRDYEAASDLRRDYKVASDLLIRSLELHEGLFPGGAHPRVAENLQLVGELYARQGDYSRASTYLARSMELWERIYPPETFPHAHEHLLSNLDALGSVRLQQQEWKDAYSLLSRALNARLARFEGFAATASEAEAIEFASRLPQTRDLLLAAAQRLSVPADQIYGQVWRSKAVVSRISQSRRQHWASSKDPEVRADFARLQSVSRELAHLARSPDDPARGEAIRRRGRELTLDTGMRTVSNSCSGDPDEVADGEDDAHPGNPG